MLNMNQRLALAEILNSPESVPTDVAAAMLNRSPQTLRRWACLGDGPVRPVRINHRLAWPVAKIKALLEGRPA